MHRSRLSTFVIDCKTNDIDAAAEFWSGALGRAWKRQPDNDPKYRELAGTEDEPILLVQSVDHDSRIHLDIETDDLDAEVARLEALGARRVAFGTHGPAFLRGQAAAGPARRQENERMALNSAEVLGEKISSQPESARYIMKRGPVLALGEAATRGSGRARGGARRLPL